MGFELLVAPPGAGKTRALVRWARELAARGERVWWVGLPPQRGSFYRLLVEEGPVLGVEFLSSQQLCYRLLARARRLRPTVVGTERLALVGEALKEIEDRLPSPGEARLFAAAVAEAKRYGLAPSGLTGEDPEVRRLREVFAAYERLKGDRWDYDDVRSHSVELARAGAVEAEAQALVVDGFREIGPLELELYRSLSTGMAVRVSLPEAPPGARADRELSSPPGSKVERYRAPNPVSEARWVLRSLKRDLADAGYEPLELAVIMPPGDTVAFRALADEYGVPVMDETPCSLADTLPGRVLLDLLELPEYPTASRLLAVPELAPLADAALDAKVAGEEAIGALAARLGLHETWTEWRERLAVSEDEMGWARGLLERTVEMLRDVGVDGELDGFRAEALTRAKEASRLARGREFRAWWAALLEDTWRFERRPGGVALLDPNRASGRRFRRVYLMRATEGRYGGGEREDYFLAEEHRLPWESLFASRAGLPRRFLGRDRSLFAELLTRGDETVITYPEADQGGPLLPETELLGEAAIPALPAVPAGSRLELPTMERYRPSFPPQPLGTATVRALHRYDQCGFRFWLRRRLPAGERPWWSELLLELRERGRLDPARLDELRSRYPEAAQWLERHSATLLSLRFGVWLPGAGEGPRAYLDALGGDGNEVFVYRFTAPGSALSTDEAAAIVEGRWNELWAAGELLASGAAGCVHLIVWPVAGEPVSAYEGGIRWQWRRIVRCRDDAGRAYARFARGEVSPSPGYHCRECEVGDVCRERNGT